MPPKHEKVTCARCPSKRCCRDFVTTTNKQDLERYISAGNQPHSHPNLADLNRAEGEGIHYVLQGSTAHLTMIGICAALDPNGYCRVHFPGAEPSCCVATQEGGELCPSK